MASFSEEYKTVDESSVDGGNEMSDGNGLSLGGGFIGGLVVGGLAGWAFSRDRGANYGTMPYAVSTGTYTVADMENLKTDLQGQYNTLSAISQGTFDNINRVDQLGTNLAQGLASLGYENARLANANQVQTMQSAGQTQLEIANASAKADLCCCQTKGLIAEESASIQGQIANIVPTMQNFYLTDEVSKLRAINAQNTISNGFTNVNNSLEGIGDGIKAILAKLYSSSTVSS